MAFSETDLSNIEAAIVAISTGAEVVSVEIAGKKWTYNVQDSNRLENLLTLRTVVQRELGHVPTTLHLKNGGRSRS